MYSYLINIIYNNFQFFIFISYIMNTVQSETEYTDFNGRKMYYCNSTANGQEYYLSNEDTGKVIGGALSIPLLLSSIGITGVMSIIFGVVALGIRYGGKDKKTNGGIIALVIFFFLCLISMTGSIVSMRININTIKKSGKRPCYSTKESIVIEKE